jgi:hypothetical protein
VKSTFETTGHHKTPAATYTVPAKFTGFAKPDPELRESVANVAAHERLSAMGVASGLRG